MTLTGPMTLLVLTAIVVASIAGLALSWERVPAHVAVRWPARIALVALCQVAALVLAFAVLNDQDQFYTSWGDLFGSSVALTTAPSPAQAESGVIAAQLRSQGHITGSTIVHMLVADAGTDRDQSVLVYLPGAYFTTPYRDRDFPVVEFLDGFPGSPYGWTHPVHIQTMMDREISSGRMAPFIAVFPHQNVQGNRDTECLNLPGGPQMQTTLVDNVRAALVHDVRASSNPHSWALIGMSTGGYCALDIGLQHPTQFGAVVSLAGNTVPYQDGQTGPIFRGRPAFERANDPLRLAAQGRARLDVLVASAHGDASLPQNQEFVRDARMPLHVWSLFLPRGAHTFATIRVYTPVCLDWIGAHLQVPPYAPPATASGHGPTSARPARPRTRPVRGARPRTHPVLEARPAQAGTRALRPVRSG